MRGSRTLRFVAAALWAFFALTAPRGALACACCTNPGQRYVEVEALDSGRLEQIESVRFGKAAMLFVGEADPQSIAGIATPVERYDLTVAWDKSRPGTTRAVFALGNQEGRSGTLSLELPKKISIFEVDPRDSADEGTGPTLYKEWKLTGEVTGSDAFASSNGPRQRLTLILQGRGNACTSGGDFTAWTLVMQGPRANYALFGDLVPSE
jgi:hypothetical protein